MALLNTKKSALFLKSGAVLPVAPANFLEVEEEILLTPDIPIEEFKRINGLLGSNSSYADTCHMTISQSVSTKMRKSNSAGDALDTLPEYSELLKIGGFDVEIAETLVIDTLVGITVGMTITGDTSTATGTVLSFIETQTAGAVPVPIYTITVGNVANSPFEVAGETLNTAAFTASSAGFSPRYTNTQTPVLGSAVAYIDGYKHQMTGSLAADITMNFPVGKACTITGSLSAFLDNAGVAATEATPTVTLNPESVILAGCADIFTAGGTALSPDNVSIAMGADIQEFFGLGGLKEYAMQDYMIKVTADFYPENANYNDAVTKLGAGTTEAIVIKLGTLLGTEVNGSTVVIKADTSKASAFSDSNDKSSVKRSFTWLLQGTEQISITHGKHV